MSTRGRNRIELNDFRFKSSANHESTWIGLACQEEEKGHTELVCCAGRHVRPCFRGQVDLRCRLTPVVSHPYSGEDGHTSKSGNPMISPNSTLFSLSSPLAAVLTTSGNVFGSTKPRYTSSSKPFSMVPGGWSGV